MKIIDVIQQKQAQWIGKRQPVIAFLGDSVTHGCFEIFMKEGKLETKVDMDYGYIEKIKSIFRHLYPDVPITYVSAGISGDSADIALTRLQADVLDYKPDLVVVMFGLNDGMQRGEGLDKYRNSLKSIFEEIRKTGAEIIFMTPNLPCDKLPIPYPEERLNEVIQDVIRVNNEGWFDKYFDEVRELCKEMNIPVCDCNKMWHTLKDNGVDTNRLLSNRVNHPTREMHWMFAYELVRTMFLEK